MEELRVRVTGIETGEVTNLVKGYFVIRGRRFRFSAVAYGRYGGQNIMPKISNRARSRLAKMGLDPESLMDSLQQKLITGDIALGV